MHLLLHMYLDEACCRVASLLKMFLPVLLLDFEGKARSQDALHSIRVSKQHEAINDLY